MTTISADDLMLSSPPPAIVVRGLGFRYGNSSSSPSQNAPDDASSNLMSQPRAIEDISFSLRKSELLLVAGPSGCGKSTLLKCLNGLIPRSYAGVLSGEIQLEGRSITGLSLRDLARTVGTMLQDPDKQIIGSTIEQEVAFGMENLNTPPPEMCQRIQEVLERLHLVHYRSLWWSAPAGCRRRFARDGALYFPL